MAELTFKSPGVSTREIDLSGPTALGPQGTPAGIIGTALKGRAFVPITVATYQDFVAEFGSTDGEKFGPLAMNEWMRNARAGTYVRVLGVGDGKQRNPSSGIVSNAGFIVGERQVKENGLIGSAKNSLTTTAGANPFAVAPIDGGDNQTASNDQLTFTDTGDVEETVVIVLATGNFGGAAKSRVAVARAATTTTITVTNNLDNAPTAATITTLVAILANREGDATDNTATLEYVGATRVKAGLTVAAKAGVDASAAVAAHAGVALDGGPEDDRPQPLGRMTFLGSLMVDANSSGLLADSGIAAATAKSTAKLAIADGTGLHGLAAGQRITLISTDTTSKSYVFVDPALSDADTTAGSHTPLVANGVLGASATVTGVKAVIDDAINVTTTAADDRIIFNVPATASGEGGDVTIKFVDALGVAEANIIKVLRDGLSLMRVLKAINGNTADGEILFGTGRGTAAAGGIAGITAEAGGTANHVKLTLDRPGDHVVSITNGAGDTVLAQNPGADYFSAGGGEATAGTAGDIAVMLTGNRATALNALRAAILSSNGHDGKITASDALTPAAGSQSITLTQAVAGDAGDSVIASDPALATITRPARFSGGFGAASGKPILRGAIMAADGVVISLKSEHHDSDTLETSRPPVSDSSGTLIVDAGASHGTVSVANGKQSFEMYLNGHISTGLHPSKLKLSLDPADPSYFAKVLNTDPAKTREAGHYLYAYWDVHPALALPDDAEVGTASATNEEAVFVLVGGAGRNAGSANQPNFEDFQDRFGTARTPYFVSQDFGAGVKNLFRVHALDDGAGANDLFKITIENIAASSNENNKFGKFDLVVRGFYDNDSDPVVLEAYRGVNLDRSSENYIARRIGDQHAYYDFDQRDGAQKLRIEGAFTNRSRYMRVELHSDVTRGALPDEALPVGFRGHGHLSLDGDTSLNVITDASIDSDSLIDIREIRKMKMVPVPFRRNVAQGKGNKKRSNADLCWGVQFERIDSVEEPNKNTVVDESIASFTKFFPDHRKDIASAFVSDNAGAADLDGAVLDSDRYNNNFFSLERVQVVTGSNDRPVVNEWAAAAYKRDGVKGTLTSANGATHDASDTRFLDVAKDFAHLPTRKYLKFTTFLQQGFDGLNIFDKEKSKLSDIAARREFGESDFQGGVRGPTIAAYRKAIDVMEEKADVEIQLLAIPGLRHPSVTDYAIDSVENRFDAMLLMDIEEKDQINEFVTGSAEQLTNVTYTVNNFESRNLDSSFAAAYFPDVVITDPATGGNVQCPPSVAVLGAFSLNDSVSHPWFAPAGFTRGALNTVLESQVKLKRANLDALYEADINPITSFPHTPGVVVFGQKTLQAAQSALDRVNVRRLLIDIRRRVKKIAQSLLFEPNRVDTLARFSNLVNPVMQQIQAQQGLDRYKVQIDTSTTTQADVENNTIRGKIFLQPTRSLEFISLDFVVTNQGAEI